MGIRVFIVDDHPMTRAGLLATLEREADFEVVGVAADGIAAWDIIGEKVPDVALVDLVLPGGDGTELTAALARQVPGAACLILTGNLYPSEIILTRAEEHGVPVLTVRDDTYSVARRLEALRQAVREGEGLLVGRLDGVIARPVDEPDRPAGDDPRQPVGKRVCLLEGRPDDEPARRVDIAPAGGGLHRRPAVGKRPRPVKRRLDRERHVAQRPVCRGRHRGKAEYKNGGGRPSQGLHKPVSLSWGHRTRPFFSGRWSPSSPPSPLS